MRKTAAFALGIGLACLAGCASGSDGWVKAGTTEEERGRDTLDCLTLSSTIVPGGPMGSGPRRQVDQDRYRRCMMDKGYTVPTK